MNWKTKLLLLIIYLVMELEAQKIVSDRKGPPSLNADEDLDRIERERTKNVVRLAATDQLNSEIITNRTRAYLSCESGEMIVKINFSAPFRGVAYANYDRSSHCKFYGDGSRYFEMIIPLKGCGTKQEAPRLFINNIIFRFHRSLELEEDEIKTIICRYPPPLAPPPVDPVPPVLEPTAPVPIVVPTKLSEIELLLIICGLLFLTLLLLGIGIAYYCLKRRNIKIVRKKKGLLTSAPSEITRLSHSTVFDQIRIPRATALSTESNGTIPSDYPSESLSDDDGRRTIVSETSTMRHDHFKYENTAFVPEPYPLDVDKADSVSSFPVSALVKPNIVMQDFVTTILDTENITEEDVYNTVHRRTTTQLYKKLPVTSRRKPPSIPDNDNRSESEIIEQAPRRAHSTLSVAQSYRGDWSHSEIDERPPLVPYVKQSDVYRSTTEDRLLETEQYTSVIASETKNRVTSVNQPRLTTRKIDDMYVTNVSELRTEDHIRRIKDLPYDSSASRAIESHSSQVDIYGSSRIPYSAQPTQEISEAYREETETYARDSNIHYDSKYSLSSSSSPMSRAQPYRSTRHKSELIVDILRDPPSARGVDELTQSVKEKWRTIVTTDEIFRSLIVESTTTEEYIRISRDVRYEKLFDPRTWEIIINVLTHPDVVNATTQTEVTKSTTGYRRKQASYPGAILTKVQSTCESSPSRASSKLGSVLDYDLRSITEEDVNFTRPESIWSASSTLHRVSREELTKVL